MEKKTFRQISRTPTDIENLHLENPLDCSLEKVLRNLTLSTKSKSDRPTCHDFVADKPSFWYNIL